MPKVATCQVLTTSAATDELPSSVLRAYVSDSISCFMLVDARCYCQRSDNAIALDAFNRLAIAAIEPSFGNISTALYEFLTFTEARGWQPLYFEIAEVTAPILCAQDFKTIKLQSQSLNIRYLAYRCQQAYST